MARTLQTFRLKRQIFNQDLYQRLRDVWFAGAPDAATPPNIERIRQWLAQRLDSDNDEAFTRECASEFKAAVSCIGPSAFTLTAFRSYEDESMPSTARCPFHDEGTDVEVADREEAAETLLSLIILLDLVPRIVMREPQEMRAVHEHYARQAFTLLHTCWTESAGLVDHACWRTHPERKMFLFTPLLHSEFQPSHELLAARLEALRHDCEGVGNTTGVTWIAAMSEVASARRELLQRFGRFPERNVCLGRSNTPEEDAYLSS